MNSPGKNPSITPYHVFALQLAPLVPYDHQLNHMNQGKKTMKINSKFPEARAHAGARRRGRALCLEFAARGWRIAVTDIDEADRRNGGPGEEAGARPGHALDVTRPGDFTGPSPR